MPSPEGSSPVLSAGDRRRRQAVLMTFPLAFAVHDLEEVLTAEAWGPNARQRLAERFPRLPHSALEVATVTRQQMATAVAVVSLGVVAATVSGWRRADSDLGLMPAALTVYTGHGITHLAQSALLGGYTPGVATVPLVVAPYSLWAWRELRRTGLRRRPPQVFRDAAVAGAAAVALAVTGHVLGRQVGKAARR